MQTPAFIETTTLAAGGHQSKITEALMTGDGLDEYL